MQWPFCLVYIFIDDHAAEMDELKAVHFTFLATTVTISDHHDQYIFVTLILKMGWPK